MALTAAVITGCGQKNVLPGMVKFDRAYIPALSLTYDADTVRSKAALADLTKESQVFLQKYRSWVRASPQRQADMNRVTEQVKRASLLVESGALAGAHDALEQVRNVMLDMRRREGIEYLPDYLTEFHHIMERLVSATDGRSALTLSPAALDSITADYAEVRQAWTSVMSAGIDAKVHGFDSEKLAAVKAHIQAVSDALDRLGAALDAHDRTAVVKAVAEVKSEFAALYKQFGDYGQTP